MMRRCIVLRVVYQPVDDVRPPDRVPELPKNSRFLRGRMMQMRGRLGMTEKEIDSLLDKSEGKTEDPFSSGREVAEFKDPTWADIVEERERTGKLFSARTITEAFPYMSGQPRGMPDFKDNFREEQLLAHTKSPTNHPSSIMIRLQEERMRGVMLGAITLYLSYLTTVTYLDQQLEEADPVYSRQDFYFNRDQSLERVTRGDEELLPILKADRDGYVVAWVPQSKVAHMMWHNREGHSSSGHVFTSPSFTKRGGILPEGVSYTYPAPLARLVDSNQSQVKFQHEQMIGKELQKRIWGKMDEA